MIDYTVPKYKGDFQDFNEQEFDILVKQVDSDNQELYKMGCESHEQVVKSCASHYGYHSKQLRYISKEKPNEPPNLYRKSLTPTIRRYRQWQDKQSDYAKYQSYVARRKGANLTLEALGFEPYEDYEPSSAITALKKLAIVDDNGHYVKRELEMPVSQVTEQSDDDNS